MKIGTIVAQNPVAAGLPVAQAGRAGGGLAALAGGGLEQAVGVLLDAESRASAQRQKLEVAQREAAARVETAELKAAFELMVQDGAIRLGREETDPDAYKAKWAEMVQASRDAIEQRIRMPETRQALAQTMPGIIEAHGAKSLHHADALRLDRGRATTMTALESMLKRGALGDDIVWQTTRQEALNLIGDPTDPRTPQNTFFSAQEQQKLRAETEERWDTLRARRDMAADPQGFAENYDADPTRYGSAKLETMLELRARAAALIDTRARQAEQKWNNFIKQIEDDAESERQLQLSVFAEKAYAKTATMADLNDLRAMRIVRTREEYEHFRKVITDTSTRPSDPAALQDVKIRINAPVPTIGQRELAKLYQTGALNEKDYTETSTRLQARLDHLTGEARSNRAEGRAIESHNQSVANQAGTKARQKLDQFFGITGPFDSLSMTPDAKNLHFLASEELANRTQPERGGKEPPAEVVDEIITRMRPTREATTALSLDKLKQAVPYPSRAALDSEWKYQQSLPPGSRTLTQSEYDRVRRILLEIEKLEEKQRAAPPPKPGGQGTMGRK